MAKDERAIHGAVRYNGTVYTAGMEEQYAEAIKGNDSVDLDVLTEKGVISGFVGGESHAARSIEPDAEGKAEQLDATGEEREEINAKGAAGVARRQATKATRRATSESAAARAGKKRAPKKTAKSGSPTE